MDNITGIANTHFRDFTLSQHQHETELGRFQEVFNRAVENQADRAEIRKAAEMFESYFIQMMFRELRKTTLNENSFIPKSHAEKIFTDMLDEQVSKDAAASGGLGLADMIYKQMTRHLD
jgi:flagellar protein FlgJ